MVRFTCSQCGAKVVLGSDEGYFGHLATLQCCPGCEEAEALYQAEASSHCDVCGEWRGNPDCATCGEGEDYVYENLDPQRCPGCSRPCDGDVDLCDRCEALADLDVSDDGTPWYAQI